MKVDLTKTGGVLSWGEEDWLAGLIPSFQDVSYSINAGGKGFAFATGIDPFYMPGSLWPGRYLTAQTTNSVIDAIQKNAITNGSQAYSIAGAKIHNFAALTGVLANAGAFPYTITHGAHTSVVGEDIVTYYIGTTKYAFYSYNDNTDGYIGRYDLATTFVDDWLTSTCTSGAALTSITSPHPMVVGDDDCLYVADGNKLHKIDGQVGAAGTYYPSKLVLPLGSIITSYSKISNYLVIYAYKPSITNGAFYKSEVRAYFWDYVSEDPTYSYPIQGNYINGGFTFKGQPGCFVQGVDPSFKSQRGGKLLLFNGSQFEEVISFPESIPGHGGVETVGNVIRWNADGIIYQWGSLFGYHNSLNRLMVSAGTTSGGMLRNLASNIWFVSAGTTSSGGAEWTGAGGSYGSAKANSGQLVPSFPIGYKGRVSSVKILWRYKFSGTGHKAKLSLFYQNEARDNAIFVILDNSIRTNNKLAEEFFNGTSSSSAANISFPTFSQIGWDLTYTAGTVGDDPDVIQRIEIHYENVKI